MRCGDFEDVVVGEPVPLWRGEDSDNQRDILTTERSELAAVHFWIVGIVLEQAVRVRDYVGSRPIVAGHGPQIFLDPGRQAHEIDQGIHQIVRFVGKNDLVERAGG
jgi:hypothetical protein